MKFMIVGKGSPEIEGGALPSREYVEEMRAYNQSLARAGVLLASEGLYPSSRGAQIAYSGGKATVIDGPFAEAKELIAGFWLIQVKSREEAIEWALRLPMPPGAEGTALDVWQVFDASDAPDDTLSGRELEREEAMRERLRPGDPGA
jgi:hypothetical protein